MTICHNLRRREADASDIAVELPFELVSRLCRKKTKCVAPPELASRTFTTVSRFDYLRTFKDTCCFYDFPPHPREIRGLKR
jgi:hypothetical protein